MSVSALGRFLMSDKTAEDCMFLSDMDGFLTAIAIGPEMIMPPEWMPYILGAYEPAFESQHQAESFYSAIMEWYNGILRTISEAPETYEPYIYFNKDDKPVFADWAEGFLIGVSLRERAWKALSNSQEYGHHFVPIMVHMPDEQGGYLVGDGAYNAVYETLCNDDSILPRAVIEIDRFWKQARDYYQGRPE